MPGVHGAYLPYMVKVTPSVKASTFEASCEPFTVARVARRRLRNGILCYHIRKTYDRARRSDTVAVPGTLGVTITVPDVDLCKFLYFVSRTVAADPPADGGRRGVPPAEPRALRVVRLEKSEWLWSPGVADPTPYLTWGV